MAELNEAESTKDTKKTKKEKKSVGLYTICCLTAPNLEITQI